MAIIKEKKLKISSVIEDMTPSGLADGEAEHTEITTDAFLKISDGATVISYTENTEDGRVVSDITLTEASVTVTRRGAVESEMVFSEGGSYKSLYQVPPLSFDMEIYTKKIRNNMTRDGGRVDIFYTMKIGGAERYVRMKIETL